MRILRRTALLCVVAAGVACAVGGCGRSSAALDNNNPMTISTSDRMLVRYEVTDLLEAMFFEVERPPRSPDRIDTLPLTSSHFTEFWRPDVRTFADRMESALHTMQRTVTVYLRKAATLPGDQAAAASESADGLSIEVVVRKERLSMPSSIDATGASEAYSVFSGSVQALEDYEKKYGVGIRWVDYGRDKALEQYILKRILKRLQ
ncbi:MAG: hypothetical protein GWP05_03755 [Anaerolineaceae bacterium]|nr:hypothetical protein [Anaerolineaceae bacterium]